MAKFDPLKMLLGPLAGGTIYDSPIAQFLSIKDPNEKRRLEAEAEAEAKKSAAPGMKPADARGGMRYGGMRHGGMKHGGAVKKMAKGGKLTDLTGDGKVTRADVLKGRGVKGFSKGGTASKRADGCATKGKTKGRFV